MKLKGKELKSRSKLAMMFAKSKGYENYSEKWWDTANECYSKYVEKYINIVFYQMFVPKYSSTHFS